MCFVVSCCLLRVCWCLLIVVLWLSLVVHVCYCSLCVVCRLFFSGERMEYCAFVVRLLFCVY